MLKLVKYSQSYGLNEVCDISELAVIKVRNPTSNKDINKFINNAIEKDITKPQVKNNIPTTTEDSPFLSTTSLLDISKDSILSKVIISTENSSIPPL